MKHFFYKGPTDILESKKEDEDIVATVKKEFKKVFEVRNLSFLLGSGCSSGANGIPTMRRLAEMFYEPAKDILEAMSETTKAMVLNEDCKKILSELNIDFTKPPFADNLEAFLGTLYSLKYYYEQINSVQQSSKVQKVIRHTKKFILFQCLNSDNQDKDSEIRNTYKNFYRKLSLRDSNLLKPNIFTTNYDLYSERAMDELGIAYTNGFSGFIDRYFNPSIFNYALAEQMEISSAKWNVIDSFIYLFKIHGSLNWVEDINSTHLFKIKELQDVSFDALAQKDNVMIYPSPIKQNASLGMPYSDLFREFKRRIAQNQSVLITIGYSFSDEHINNLIYQALTIPTFRLVVFSELGIWRGGNRSVTKSAIEQLRKLDDPRIWIIGSDHVEGDKGEVPLLYYFDTIAKILLPDWSENLIEEKNQNVINIINQQNPVSNGER